MVGKQKFKRHLPGSVYSVADGMNRHTLGNLSGTRAQKLGVALDLNGAESAGSVQFNPSVIAQVRNFYSVFGDCGEN